MSGYAKFVLLFNNKIFTMGFAILEYLIGLFIGDDDNPL